MENNKIKITNNRAFAFAVAIVGVVLMLALWVFRLNSIAVVSAAFCCIVAALIFLQLVATRSLNLYFFIAYVAPAFGVTTYYVVWGVDQIFILRLVYNTLLALPSFLVLFYLYKATMFGRVDKIRLRATLSAVVLIFTSVVYVLTMSLKSKPTVVSLQEGHDDYLKNVDTNRTDSNSPNVLVVLTDDLGYGDISLNGALYDTPNIDSIGENGLQFENFYSSYSVCSPARFAAMTGRYPYRGYADNVLYPTVASFVPFGATRHLNSFEMGANVDGMLGDEITVAEVLQQSGYATGAFGKWHLGDYGQYLPTNQGFDYFYGSHHVNDMTPFYHVRESGGEYEIAVSKTELDQSKATSLIHEEIDGWVRDTVQNTDKPFFAYYATPWPHAPIFVGDEYKGVTGMGDYADCVTEFDAYLGKLLTTLDELGELDDTIIVFTSDNGPALQGSVNELRGGKYLAYEGGQKVPFLLQWNNNNGLFTAGESVSGAATLVDLFPTLVELTGVTGKNGTPNYLPFDRVIDGISMRPLLDGSREVIHTIEHPILHMKREKIKALQYSVPTAEVKAAHPDYTYDVLSGNYVTFKYFERIQNDNSAFFDKYRKNWLHILTDDSGENYNRTPTYPDVADKMNARLKEIKEDFENNRRGRLEEYYD